MTFVLIHRFNIFVNLLVATFIGFIHVPMPEISEDIVYYLVKRLDRLVSNGESYSDSIHSSVQSDESDACSVVAQNEPGDGPGGPFEEDGYRQPSELESDGKKND